MVVIEGNFKLKIKTLLSENDVNRLRQKQLIARGAGHLLKQPTREQSLEIAISIFIAENGISLRTLDSPSWLHLCTLAGIPCRSASTYAQTLIPLIAGTLQKARDVGLQQAAFVSAVIDGWDAGRQSHAIGIVIHSISRDWTMKREFLDLFKIRPLPPLLS